jgi:hypothetical protein
MVGIGNGDLARELFGCTNRPRGRKVKIEMAIKLQVTGGNRAIALREGIRNKRQVGWSGSRISRWYEAAASAKPSVDS